MKITPYMMPSNEINALISIVANDCGITVEQMLSSKKAINIYAKKIIIYILVNEYKYTYLYLAKIKCLNSRYHTTFLYLNRDAQWLYDNEDNFKQKINKIKSIINYGNSN